ncbi:MAG: hypothetical protein A2Y81_00820 [Nitrospirae bacterium RBG_13_43_8]|nr:MAG: hypothetical protein A2Y81_00820 [Nitrospirae bacterium RBG_13_43_8]
MNFEIANVTFALKFDYPLTPQDLDSTFISFLKTPNASSATDIDISFKLDNMPDTTEMTKIFDCSQSWYMFKNGFNYYMVTKSPNLDNKPIWVVSFDHNIKRVTVYLGNRAIIKSNDRVTVPNLISFPVGQILLMYFLSHIKGALIHAAGLGFNGRGYIFPGKSGAGKSTLTRQFAHRNDFEFLSDDRIAVRKIDNQLNIFGTPWPGDAGIALNKSVNLSGIFFITQANYNRIEEIKPQKALEKLLPVVSIPWYDKEVMIKILDFCDDLFSNIPAYELYFKPDSEVVDVFKIFVSRQ